MVVSRISLVVSCLKQPSNFLIMVGVCLFVKIFLPVCHLRYHLAS